MRLPLWVRLTWPSLLLAALLLPASPAAAQATRTWVSGIGDDANPCSRTAPCRTFAGAISKTATGGEINVLDPGGFGSVTITKSITISAEDVQAGVLATLGANGIVVNAAADSVVVLRGLDLEGLGSGGNGIRFLAGAALHVESCTINNFAQKGIDFQPSGDAELFVVDSIVRDNQVSAVNSGGIFVKPGVAGSAMVSLVRVQLSNNQFGLRVEDGTTAVVSDSTASGNVTNGFLAMGDAAIDLESSVSSHNGTNGVRATLATSVIRLSNTLITGNSQGLSANGGAIVSFGNNSVVGNGVDGSPTQTIPQI